MTSPSGEQRPAEIDIYLRSPQFWWAYLAIRSNPSIATLVGGCQQAIFFDNPSLSPSNSDKNDRVRYFFIFWDGVTDAAPLEEVTRLLGGVADLTFLVVGDYTAVANGNYKIQSLYPEGQLSFERSNASFDLKTSVLLMGYRAKNLTVPLKNLIGGRTDLARATKLLCGRKQIVFCGSYGITQPLVEMLCNRYSADHRLFEQYEWFNETADRSFENCKQYLRKDGEFFADLFVQSKISATFFLSIARLLGRGYFIERVRDAGLRIYTNQFGGGSYIDVYTTPFYSQHLFLDFGSVVGAGNYPRLADLRYFNKNVVEIELKDDLGRLLELTRNGTYEELLEDEWQLKIPRILQFMR